MYQINPNSAMTELYGLNKGEAQVFDNTNVENALLRKQHQEQVAQKENEAKLSGLMSDVSKVGKGEIRPADIDYFANEQKSLYDDVKKAFAESKGGVLPIEKQVDFESRIADIQRKALISGARHKQNMSEYQKAVLNPDKFNRQEEIAKIQADSFDKANGGNFNEPLTTLTESFDTQKYIKDVLRPIAEDLAKKGGHDYINPNTGDKTSYTYNNLTPAESEKIFSDTVLKNHRVFSDEAYKLSKDPEAQKKYGDDVNSYIKDKYFNQFLINNDQTRRFKGGEGDGNEVQDVVSDVNSPESYKISAQGTGGKQFDATVDVAQSAQLAKPISIPLTITTSTRDINGNTLPEDKGVYKTTGSELRVVPVYKKGVKSEGGESELGGSAIPKERMKDALSKGVVEYKTMFYGNAKLPDGSEKEISIMKPADELRGALGKSVKTLDKLNTHAKELNSRLGSATKSKSESTPKFLDTDTVKIKIGDKEYIQKASVLRSKGYKDEQFYK